MFWTIIGIAAATLTMFGFLPQGIKMIKTRSAKDVSGLTLIQFSIGGMLWLLYGIHLNDIIIIGANAVSLCTLFIDLGIYIRLTRGTFTSRRKGR